MLGGDYVTLDELFVVSINGDDEAWVLECVPRSAELAEMLVAMRVSGTASQPAGVFVDEIFIDQGENRWQRIRIDAESSAR